MNNTKIYKRILTVLCVIMAFGFSLSLLFGVRSYAFASTNDFEIVFDDYDGADLTVDRYQKVNLPTATFKHKGLNIGKAELLVYDSEDNVVPSYRKGAYLFTEVGEYTAVYYPIGYTDRGVDGGDKNLELNITVHDAQLSDMIYPVDDSISTGLIADFNEDFYVTDVFTDYGNANIYLSEYPEVSLTQIEGNNNAIKMVKGANIAKIGLYFGAGIDVEVTDLSYISIKLKSNADEIYLASLSEYKFYSMQDLSSATLGDFSYDKDGYQTIYVKANDLGLSKDNFNGIQLVFDGANGAFVEIDEIGFVAERKDYKYVTGLTKNEVVEGDKTKITVNAYFNGVQISSPVLSYAIPEQFQEKSTITQDGNDYYFNALKSGETALKVTLYDTDGQTEIDSQDLTINVLSAREVVDRLTSSLKENELVTWGDANYKYAMQKTVLVNSSPDFHSVTVNQSYNQVRYINQDANGTPTYGATRILFPGSPTYTDGYIRITCIFDGYNSSRYVRVYNFDETDADNYVASFEAFTGPRGGVDRAWYVWVIPVTDLVDENNKLNGIQIVNTASWMNFGRIDYIPENEYTPNYFVSDNVSTLPLYENGDVCTVVPKLESDGFVLDNQNYYIEITTTDNSVLDVDGLNVIPKNSGNATVTVSYYKDSTKQELIASKTTDVVIDTIENILSPTLTDDKLVAWDHVLYENFVTESTVANMGSANEGYTSYVNKDYSKGYYFDFVPANDGNGSGRTITFPVQNTYTDGYVKLTFKAQSGLFQSYTSIYVYKIGETNVNNYVIKATGNDALKDKNAIEIYVPVNMLTNEQNVLEGLQITAAGMGWLQVHEINYVPETNFEPTYGIIDNLSTIALAEGGSAQTVTASLLFNGMPVGPSFAYTIEVASSNTEVVTVSGTSVTPVKEGETTLTITLKDGNTVLASAQKEISVSSLLETIRATLKENELVKWDSQLYINLVSDSTVNGLSMANESETYKSFVNADFTKGYFFDFVPASTELSGGKDYDGSGRTITFPVQNTYTDGYVKFKLCSQGGNTFAGYMILSVYKIGETNKNNFVLQATGDAINGKTEIEVYVPVSMLTNEQNVLEGLQIAAAGGGWLQVHEIYYVPETEHEPVYGVYDNVSELTFAYGGTAQTVTTALTCDGFNLGSSFDYTTELESSNTQVATVSGMAITPAKGGKTIITITIKDSLGNQIAKVEREITVESIYDKIAPTLGENELVNFKSSLQAQLLTETTIPEYQGNVKNTEIHGGGWACFKFYATDTTKAVGYNVEFATKNTYTDGGYIMLPLLSQRTGVILEVYKFGETGGDPVYTATMNTANAFSFHYIPVSDLANAQGVVEGVQIVMFIKDGCGQICGSTDGQNVNAIKYVSNENYLVSMLGENELINWTSDVQTEYVTETTITDYQGGISAYNGIKSVNNALAYQVVDKGDGKLAGLNIEFVRKLQNPTGYVKFEMQNTQNWEGGGVYVCKYGETDATKIGNELGKCTEKNIRYPFYVPVETLLNDQGVLEGMQIVFYGSGGNVNIFAISLVAEIPQA